ncbi:MAG TPA: LytTR family DNA-binding domain-containing protein [Burkholderiaceae bacterium]
MPIRYLIVDDEELGRENLRLAMAPHADWRLAGECAGAAGARTVLAAEEADVIFLDIHMPAESGLSLARELSRLPEPPLIIFVTAYSAHAVDAFELHALDYLLKPLNDDRLAQTVKRAQAMLQARQRAAYGAALRDFVGADTARRAAHVNVRSVGRIEQIAVADILWAESAGNYVQLHLPARSLLHRVTLSHLESVLGAQDYVRVHRRTIVRRDQIASLVGDGDGHYQLGLRCGGTVAVSERYAGQLKASM